MVAVATDFPGARSVLMSAEDKKRKIFKKYELNYKLRSKHLQAIAYSPPKLRMKV